MRIFVTGGTGFIGSHLIRLAIQDGHDVTALRRRGSITRIPLPPGVNWIEGDMESIPEGAMDGCESVIHLAAYGVNNPAKADWQKCYRINVNSFIELVTAATKTGISKFTIAGSCFEYGRAADRYDFISSEAPLEPTGPYHASKAAATLTAIGLATSFNLHMTVLRPFHVYGEGEEQNRLWASLKAAAAAGESLDMTSGEQIRDFTPVEDVAKMFLHHTVHNASKPGIAMIANLGTGYPRTVKKFAEDLWEKWEAQGTLRFGLLPYRENEVMRYVPEIRVHSGHL